LKPLTIAAAAGAGAALLWAGWIEPRRLVTVRRTVELPRWPQALDGLRVGLLTDLHAGAPHAGLEPIARAVERLNAEAPDLTLLLGDFVDSHSLWRGRVPPELVAREVAALEAPLGRYAVLGNHDWRATGDRMWTALERAGVPVLENRSQALGRAGLHVAGLADLRKRRPDLPSALAGIPPDAPILLLAHDPDVFPYVPARVALTLSGHTHGGQVAIPRVRRPAIPSRHGELYARGHVVQEGRHLYVSSGVGTSGLPLRLLAPPEVVILELTAPGRPPAAAPGA
jgi:predicted MPP superfamily phosphohydrolase